MSSNPPSSTISLCDSPEEQEWRPLATAIHSHLLPDDIGRQVIIVRDKRRSPTAFQKALEGDEDDLDDEPWF